MAQVDQLNGQGEAVAIATVLANVGEVGPRQGRQPDQPALVLREREQLYRSVGVSNSRHGIGILPGWLESIYVQAKRWQATVGRPDIQQFAGALHGNRVRKNVFITTSSFSREAIEYARTSQIAIVLIDGEQLADYMLEFGIGVSDVETIKLQKLDEDYFLEE